MELSKSLLELDRIREQIAESIRGSTNCNMVASSNDLPSDDSCSNESSVESTDPEEGSGNPNNHPILMPPVRMKKIQQLHD